MNNQKHLVALMALGGFSAFNVASYAQNVNWGAVQRSPVAQANLPNLREAPVPAINDKAPQHQIIELRKPPPIDRAGKVHDPVIQRGKPASANLFTSQKLMDGIGVGLGNYSPSFSPPDPTGAAGASQYVQMVNSAVAVFDKGSGVATYGPVPANTLFQPLGGACAQNHIGDPIVQYDKAAKRWIMSGIVLGDASTGYWQCLAISKTSDATGGYNLYAYQYDSLNDYPKIGVWPDGYYITFNMFSAVYGFVGAQVCAYDREKMLRGDAAEQQCMMVQNHASLLPADLDGSKSPPKGSPNYLISRAVDSLNLWKYKVDWKNPSNTTLTGPIPIPVAPYNVGCATNNCVPQPDSTQLLDSLSDRLMFRLAYRNVGGIERMVINHSVTVNNETSPGNLAVRWYEIRDMRTTPTIYQQSSYSPDTHYRWMGSAAMDKQGNMAVGYAVSSSTLKPSIAVSARLASDQLGELSDETVMTLGTGSQINGISRWGDYTHMSIDPEDDCTFWYTGQYLKNDGAFNWSTKIGSFKFSACH